MRAEHFRSLLVLIIPFLVSIGLAAAQEGKRERGLDLGGAESPEQPGTRRAVVVGISDYLYLPEGKQLDYADSDAQAFYEFLRSKAGGSVDSTNIRYLVNQEATSGQIYDALAWLVGESKPGDEAIFYFAGHGDVETVTLEEDGFLLAANVPPGNNYWAAGTVQISNLQKFIARAAHTGARVIVVTDACRAGKLVGTNAGAQQTTSALLQEWQGVVKLVSSHPDELSHEGLQWGGGHGVFTHFLIEGLLGLCDTDGDSVVTVREAVRYVEDNVSAQTGGKQNPSYSGDSRVPLAIVDPEVKALALDRKREEEQAVLIAARSAAGADGGTDPAVVRELEAFQSALRAGALIKPAGSSAWEAYQRLAALPSVGSAAEGARGALAAAFQDDAEKLIVRYLEGGNDQPPTARFRDAAKELAYASELLGEGHILRPTVQARQFFLEGYVIVRAEERQKYGRALELLQRSVALQPEAAYAHNALASLLLDLNRFEDAKREIEEAIRRAPTWEYPWNLLGNLYLDQRRYAEAREAYRRAIEVNPSSYYPYANLGVVAARLSRYSEAETYYRKALGMVPGKALLVKNLGNNFESQGRYIEAQKAYIEAFSLDSTLVWTYTAIGDMYGDLGKFEEAEAYLRKGIELEPFFPEPLVELGDLYHWQAFSTHAGEAERFYQKAIELDPLHVPAYNGLGRLYLNQGRYEEAERVFTQADSLVPHAPEPIKNLGDFYTARKRYEEAEAAYLEATRRDSLYIWAYNGLSRLYEDRGRYREAEAAFKRASKLFPDSPELAHQLGDYYFRRGEYAKAEQAYLKTTEVDSSYARVYSSLAWIYLERGRFAEAVDAYRRAVAFDTFNHSARWFSDEIAASGGRRLEAGDARDAVEAYRQAVRLDPENHRVLHRLAHLLYLAGDVETAAAFGDRCLAAGDLTGRERMRYLATRGHIWLDSGSPERALEAFEQAIENNPDPSYAGKAMALLDLGRREEALAYYEKELKENPLSADSGELEKRYSKKARKRLEKLRGMWERRNR